MAASGITSSSFAPDAITAAKVAADVSAEIADAVLDEALSGHTTAGSLGQRLQPIRTGTAQGGAAGTITLDASASATPDFYNGHLVQITSGTGANQARLITDYNESTKVATVAENWSVNPDNTSVFILYPGGNSVPAVDVTKWNGTNVVTPAMPGRPDVNASHIGGSSI